ncbi:DUF4115 domain-containing protein [Herbaspirillum sp. RTI4]|uniref:helix-turn-helix domain-containing protein n=1 Tax=Herbaspirillum sp. RTI4 TaxID=3048640 RepID=UPI002AB3A7D1|nr:RodZ domain-containing protein [Herbaspirillum sp. RTI4]MDY7578608.1 DUF4115 domain-containing protein [Herbaspirillum sp. RTI4]MEA9981086.1 DUF4115 domain-containing protein [Herbaspirillum sp. RTI4]
MSEEQINESLATAPPVSPGAVLTARRQAKGWTVEQVASQLKMSTRQIVALESDDHASLPSAVVTRGFLRTYAKFLDLDAAPLVATLPENPTASVQSFVPHRMLATPFSESPLPLGTHRSGLWLWVLAVVVLALAAIVAVERTGVLGAFHPMDWLSASQSPSTEHPLTIASAESTESASDLPEIASSNALKETEPPPASSAVENKASANPVSSASTPETPNVVMPAPAATVAAPTTATIPATMPVKVAAALKTTSGKLNMVVRVDTWVEIRRADKSTLVSRLLKAGTTESFDIDQPVSMVVGNVSGIDVTLRGVPLDLKTGNTNNVAHLNLE